MKKLLALFVLVLSCLISYSKAFADTVNYIPHQMIVQFEQDFSTITPSKTFSVVINDNYIFPNIKPVEKGMKLFLSVVKIEPEVTDKKDATVQAKIIKTYSPGTDKTVIVNNPKAVVEFSKYEPPKVIDKKVDTNITEKNSFIKNIKLSLFKNIRKNKNDNSSVLATKEVTVPAELPCTVKGEPLVLKAGDLATLTFYTRMKQAEATPVTETKAE